MKILKSTFRILKYLTGIFVLLLIVLNLSGCFQFRSSNQANIKEFRKKGLTLFANGYDTGLHHINYIRTEPDHSSRKPVILFVHGSPGSCKDFKKSLKDSTLREHFEMISVDRPGFGSSKFGKAEPDLDKQVYALHPLLTQLADRKIIIAGHSYGGAVAARAAMLYRNEISGCLIVAGSVSADAEPKEPWRKALDWTLIRWLVPKAMSVSNDEILTLRHHLQNIESDWKRIEVPLTVLQGTKDRLVSPANADFVEKMAVNSAKLRIYRIENVDHFIPFLQEELIRDAVIEMLPDL
ncbi:MAG: alpha/beta hydrolase [Flavobacteriales bacterium]|nr:alpha/beta hydrolase [Flavobacteriales bacterium]